MQFFSFRAFVSGLNDGTTSITVRYKILNAHFSSFPAAWPLTTICYTNGDLDDDDLWRRNRTTEYVDGILAWTHVHCSNGSTFFSYYPLYTYNRHLKLISDCSARLAAGPFRDMSTSTVASLGQTKDGRQIECLSLGNGSLVAWIIHRQHPGETMAEYFAEGFLHRILAIGNATDASLTHDTELIRRVLHNYRIFVVPCMCPDGVVRGHIRTNSVGANLNREWATVQEGYDAPSIQRSPEVYSVLRKMDSTGCDFFLDVHGDEERPYVFFSGAEMTPVWGERLTHLHGFFVSSFKKVNSDVQREIGYPPPESKEQALKYLNKATKQISTRFNCLGLTLEMPFKDCATNPDPDVGFSPNRAKQLGRNLIEALDMISPFLRAEGEFWRVFDESHQYITPKNM